MANSDNKGSRIEAHRVLVLQGGGALGAYEAGVFDVLYCWIKKDQDITNPLKRRNIFDVDFYRDAIFLMWTSIGAINAAILVSYVRENNGSWEGSTQKLDFWEHVSSTPDLINYWPYWSNWPFPWESHGRKDGKTNSDIAIGEAARRYYSAKEFLLHGAPNFISKPTKTNDNRFLDDIFPFGSNVWYNIVINL